MIEVGTLLVCVGTILICKEFGSQVIVTAVEDDFIEYEGSEIDGITRASVLNDFFDIGDKNEQAKPIAY